MASLTIQHKRMIGILLVIVFILSVPLVAMQFTDEVNWDVTDFIVMGVLLSIVGLVFEMIARVAKSTVHKLVATAVLFILFLLTWVELAVGVFGTPWAGS